jgi:putative membrane protein
MKTNKWIYAILIASLGWVACDDDDDDLLDRPSLNDADETFVEKAARSNMAEIEFGELAATKATDSLLRVFAQQMVTEHTMAQDELEDLADDYAGIEWPNDLDEGHDEIMEQLNNAEQGYSFDSLYISSQIMAHQDVVDMFQTATTNSTDARVKAFANKYLPHVEAHLEQADSIQTVITANNSGTDDGTN